MTGREQLASSSIRGLYELQNRGGDNWGIDGYEIKKTYQDPILLKQQKQLAQSGKSIFVPKHPTKRGHYLDDAAKQSVSPGPNKYNLVKVWASENPNKTKPSSHCSRKTYIDDIFYLQKKENLPGPNQYNITQTEQQLKARVEKLKERKAKPHDRLSFLDTLQLESEKVPGPGSYNPHYVNGPPLNHLNTSSFVKEKNNPKDKDKSPAVCKYDPVLLDTFAARQVFSKKYPQKKNWLGTSVRILSDPRKKSEQKDKKSPAVPGPGHYKLKSDWSSDNITGQRSLFRVISTGVLKSIYY